MNPSSRQSEPPPPQASLITGGGGDLARVIAHELQQGGHRVHAPTRDEMDVTRPEQITGYFSSLGPLDLLVCNAGTIGDRLLAGMSADEFHSLIEVNLSGAFRVARAALKIMARQRRGHIVFIGSFSALSGPAGQSGYASAKAGLIALAQSLAREYGPRNIRVNTVLPGFLETKMTAHLSDDIRAKFYDAHALGRFNTPDCVARFIRFLHEEMPHTSGQVFSLDSRPCRWT